MALIFTSILIFLPFLTAGCPIVKKCLHNGSFNNITCSCQCYSSYKGEQCEYENCKNQVISV